jgi:murein DD-endopeptidase MepM/ murein hydrolase activator NlpD
MFGVSSNTVLWANNLKSGVALKPGDTLVILPVSGVEHTVLKGETLASIVKKYKGNMQDVLDFNNLSPNAQLAVGDTVIIPDGIDASSVIAAPTKVGSGSSARTVASYEALIPGSGGPAHPGYFTRPLSGGIMTQGLHGHNAVDIGTPSGSPVYAAASGVVIIARSSGYNGGYGGYIVIQHPNGLQTTYAHLSKLYVTDGMHVEQGQLIGLSGNTGRSTGPHLHFEVGDGGCNPYICGF